LLDWVTEELRREGGLDDPDARRVAGRLLGQALAAID
jgi:hypothetical protein